MSKSVVMSLSGLLVEQLRNTHIHLQSMSNLKVHVHFIKGFLEIEVRGENACVGNSLQAHFYLALSIAYM